MSETVRRIAAGVVTRNCRDAVARMFPDLDDYCGSVLTRDDVAHLKPDIRVEEIPVGKGVPLTIENTEKLRRSGINVVYGEETSTTAFVVLKEDQQVNEELLWRIEEFLRKRVKVISEEHGLLLALLDAQENFLGIDIEIARWILIRFCSELWSVRVSFSFFCQNSLLHKKAAENFF